MNRTLRLILFALSPVFLLAQSSVPLSRQFDVLSVEQGLSQGFVPGIVQDDDGFLWFATKNGLNRFDGYEFKVFKNNPFDAFSLHSNGLENIAAAGDFLIMGLDANEFSLFERRTHRFFPFPKFFSLKNASIERFFGEGKNAVWIAHSDRKVLRIARISWEANVIEQLLKGEKPEHIFKLEEIKAPDAGWLDIQPTHDGKKVWLLSETQVIERDIATRQTKSVQLPPIFNRDKINHFARVMPDASGRVWVHQANRIFLLKDGNWQVFPLPFAADHFLSFADHYNHLLWVSSGTDILGIDCSATADGKQLKIAHRFVAGVYSRSGYSDKFGNLWVGTDAHGVIKINPKRSIFRNYLPGVSVYCPPISDGGNYVLLGDLRRRNISWEILNLSNGQTRPLEHYGIYPDFSIRAAWVSEGKFWLFPYLESKVFQLVQLDPETGTKNTYELPPTVKLDFYILRIDEAAGEVWMFGIWQIIRFNMASKQFTIFDINQEKHVEVMAAERSANGSWFVGCKNGLFEFKCANDYSNDFSLSNIVAQVGQLNSLQTNDIKSLLFDPAQKEVLWIGTNGQGLTRYDLTTKRFDHFTTRNGLPDDVVYAVLADDDNPRKLWISTNRGLARFHPEKLVFQYFTTLDGLPVNEFNTIAAFKSTKKGELLFGSVNGLTIFNPSQLVLNTQLPEVRFSDLKINGKLVSPRDSAAVLSADLSFLERLELPFSDNNLSISFAATDFTSPQRNQYAFYLEGAEQAWVHKGFEHTAQYLNLPPGNYVFWVKAANSNGLWNEHPISLKVTILAPWYRTVWAYVFYFSVLSIAIFWMYRTQLYRKLEHAEALRLKTLDEFKNRFFTNITHEFRTPLTVILGMAERLLVAPANTHVASIRQSATLIKRNGENLLRLINQILDLAKLESNTLKMKYVQGDVLAYIHYIVESLYSLANAHNLQIRVHCEHPNIIMDYDPERLLQVVHNLLSNAIKFTPSGGKIVLTAKIDYNPSQSPFLSLAIQDTGVGISPEELPYIFDRFFQAQNQTQFTNAGSGIGLSLCRELTRVMGGDITVESQLGKGTAFFIRLPITKQASLETTQIPLSNSISSMPPTPLALQTPSTQAQLLLIEDNPDVIEYLTTCLSSHYQIEFAFNGRAGIEKAIEIVPDLIVSDVMMPEKDGFEVCHVLKNDERTSHVPIILLTAKADVESRLVGLRSGADVYLAKPFHQQELLQNVQNLLELRQKLRNRWSQQHASVWATAETNPEAEPNFENAFFIKFQTVLENHFSQPEFSIQTICQEMAMSRTQIYRKLMALTGQSAVEHIQNFRLEKAMALLRAGSMNVSEVAFAVGFNDPKYFSRVFSEYYGKAPSQYLPQSNA